MGSVMYPWDNVDEGVAFYSAVLGLTLKFQDGSRFASLDAGAGTVHLVAGSEAIIAAPAAAFRVEDVEAAVDAATRAGATVVRPPERGPHERRAVVRDPAGNEVVLYGR